MVISIVEQVVFSTRGKFIAMSMYDYIKEDVEKGGCLLEWDSSQGEPPVPLLKHKYGSERRKAKIMNFSLAYIFSSMIH